MKGGVLASFVGDLGSRVLREQSILDNEYIPHEELMDSGEVGRLR